ncbi:MAG: alpha/beta fold hydrolase [Myxococcales bacterium]|nr:alpha/beta fold hydrolase [Myxococcales bacterium]
MLDLPRYQPPPPFDNGHVATIATSLFRRVGGVRYQRERIDTPDGDFLDLDWARVGSDSLVILCHGLESSSEAGYIRGMARAFNRRGWDALALNFRSCSGELNRLLRSYHSGVTDDLDCVIQHVLAGSRYRRLALVGFSLGGNVVLKYAGERGAAIDPAIRAVGAISVPVDLGTCARNLELVSNWVYQIHFVRSLRRKIAQKARLHPDAMDYRRFRWIYTLGQFDEHYTAPVHGFTSADDYWTRCSSKPQLGEIRVPALLINAWDDPLLTDESYPRVEAETSRHFHLATPRHGGHVAFVTLNWDNEFWHETQIVRFVRASTSV